MEDHVAILNLLAAYGPLVDSGLSEAAARQWTDDGVYDVGSVARVQGWEALTALYDGDLHQSLIARGSAHVTTSPVISIDGDTATAVAHSLVVMRQDDGYVVWRASANHWTLRRTTVGWRVAERVNRVLDGSAESHAILARVQSP